MKSKENFGSRFLYAEDLLINEKFQSPTVEISEVHEPGTLKSADNRVIDKWAICFANKEKMLVLCKTNVSIVRFVTGELPGNGWVGKSIKIEARVVKAFGSDTTAIRVIPPVGTTLRKKLIEGLGRKAEFKKQKAGK